MKKQKTNLSKSHPDKVTSAHTWFIVTRYFSVVFVAGHLGVKGLKKGSSEIYK